ncbi:MAG: flagellar hook-basal body complex protein FliE [Rhodospirillaceae bacterium]|nr:flagellar hook-basal body complex protein FliE [Rhodospirillaceae bacterium]
MATTSIANAISAYNQASKSISNGASSAPDEAGAGLESDFSALLKAGAKTAIEAAKTGEEQSKLAIAGKADIRDVVTAVNNAEVTLQTVVAVRDKVISAYSDILKMPI